MTFVDTEGLTQGRRPRELYAVEFKYTDIEGKRVTQTLCYQRKSAATKAIEAWNRWRSKRVEDRSVCNLYRGSLTWEPVEEGVQ